MKTFQAIKMIAAELWLFFRLLALFISIFFYAKISYDVAVISSFVVDPEFKNNLGGNNNLDITITQNMCFVN